MKSNKIYDSAINLLMGLYYFYRNSSKQRKNLQSAFEALNQPCVVPTRVGGTRWVAHLLLAIETFLRAYKAIAHHLADVVAQKKASLELELYHTILITPHLIT